MWEFPSSILTIAEQGRSKGAAPALMTLFWHKATGRVPPFLLFSIATLACELQLNHVSCMPSHPETENLRAGMEFLEGITLQNVSGELLREGDVDYNHTTVSLILAFQMLSWMIQLMLHLPVKFSGGLLSVALSTK